MPSLLPSQPLHRKDQQLLRNGQLVTTQPEAGTHYSSEEEKERDKGRAGSCFRCRCVYFRLLLDTPLTRHTLQQR